MTSITKQSTEDEEARTTALGLYHFAHSYAAAAIALASTKIRSTHSDAPVRFLYRHSVELYLKAFLRQNGVKVKELRSRELGHSTISLLERAGGLGLKVCEERAQQISWLNDAEIDRYLRTGFRSVLPHDALTELVRELNAKIGGPIYDEERLSRALPQL